MARKVDAEADQASKAILDQLQTKTVGAPPSATGLTGDQLPNTIFSVADFDTVKNQVTLQLSNLELLNVLNTVGQVTNTQSQSGPIPETQENITKTTTDSNYVTIKAPKPGEVFQLVGSSAASTTNPVGNVTTEVDIYDSADDVRVLIIDISSSSTSDYPLSETNTPPIYIAHPYTLRFKCEGTFDSAVRNFSVIRVR